MKEDTKKSDFTVFITLQAATCYECQEELGRHAWIMLDADRNALCLACADLDHLQFLPSGDAALTRRSRKYSPLTAVVLQWSRRRKRYERQGLLVTESAIAQAEEECLADADVRARRRERETERRAELDQQYVTEFAQRIRELYPIALKSVRSRSLNTLVANIVGVSGGQRRRKTWMPKRFAWLWSPTFGMWRQGMMSYCHAGVIVTRRGRSSPMILRRF